MAAGGRGADLLCYMRNVHTHKAEELIAREMAAKEQRAFIDLPK
jgi:hypothetical protein